MKKYLPIMDMQEKEMAASFTGSLVKLLSIETGCHALYVEKAYSAAQRESLTAQIEKYIEENDIKVLIDFYAADENFGYVSKVWTNGEDNHRFGKKQEILRVLEDGQLADYQIGIPAFARRELGMNSINDIVVVYRDMAHILRRHSEEQTIAILGTILAVFQVITKTWIGVLVCAIFIPLILYFVLNKERIKVK